MESRNVKIVDEHGIDRNAHVICGLKVDNANYVLYVIERDNDNDNLFISKTISNLDGTSNMVNIEDSMEKSKLNDIVKELVTYAINNEADNAGTSVKLNDGRDILISFVLFNKEQNINVSKTYVTTVKKAVSKVSEDFYLVKQEEPVASQESTFFDTVKDDIFTAESDNSMSVDTPEIPVVDSIPTPIVSEPVIPVIPDVPVLPEVNVETPVVAEKVDIPNVIPSSPIPTVDDNISVNNINLEPKDPVVSNDNVTSQGAVQPIFDLSTPSEQAAPVSNGLVFDGSKETNLNEALGEISNANSVPVSDVTSLREFGQSSVSTNPEPAPVPVANDDTLVTPASASTTSGGFANNKFFMVVAILFFIAACVFLGYEAFQYFQFTAK